MKKRSERILRSERGFTLIELGVVLAIMAILAVIAYPTYTNIRKRAYEAEALAVMQEIRVEVWSHYLEHAEWPTTFPAPAGESDYWSFSGEKESVGNGYVITATGKKAPVDSATTVTLTLDKDG
ncbi:MAG TPA: prepilin-type N-terminal cleavage/methylation domain-containing protein, partial [Firmicutes bacterium]|nr:prepilin-type N-terminal cleavage/methylation domain-containing protein [Candidatus Fermentithermobacillaceae bacterium]